MTGGVIKLSCGNEIPFYHAQDVYFVTFIVDMPPESGCPSFTGPGNCFPPSWKRHARPCVTQPEPAGSSSEITGLQSVGDVSSSEVQMSEDEASRPKPWPAPTFPTAAEIEKHSLTHLPCRSWCRFCVMGRRPNAAHRAQHGRERSPPCLGKIIVLYAAPRMTPC